jgi:quinol monooxygenase YgiN
MNRILTSIVLVGLSLFPPCCLGFSLQMSANKVVCLNVKLSVKPGRREDFLKEIQNDAKQTMATEPGAVQFVLGEDRETTNVFYLHEQYTTSEDLDIHQKTPHFIEWTKFKETDPFTEPPVVDLYYGIHEAEKAPMRPAFCLNVELCIKPEVREEFLKVRAFPAILSSIVLSKLTSLIHTHHAHYPLSNNKTINARHTTHYR